MGLARDFRRSPFLLDRHIRNFGGITARMLLRFELIKGPVIGPSEHLASRELAEDFIASFFFKNLFDRFEFGNSLDPFFAPKFLLKSLGSEGALGQIVHFAAVTDFEIRE